MFSLKSFFGGSDAILGVDIGTTSIKVAEIVRGRERLKLTNYGILETHAYLERFNEALQTSSLKIGEETTADYLKLLLQRAGIRAKLAVAAVPAFLTFSTLIEVPAMSEGEIKKFMDFQGKRYIPLPLSAVSIDWMKVGEKTDSEGTVKYQILLVSIPNEQIENYQRIFRSAGLRLTGIETEGMSLARALGAAAEEVTLIVDIGSRSTSFSIAAKGHLKFSGQTDFSGGSLTQIVASGLNISQRRAEDLKKQRGLLGFGGEHELSTLMEPILDVIMNEARRVITNFETNYEEKVKAVILSGGGANMAGLADYWNKEFGLKVSKINPFSPIAYPDILSSIAKETGPLLSVAIGLALKKFV